MQTFLAAALTAFLATVSHGYAETAFDGVWTIDVSTQTADPRCKERSVSLRVEDGHVRYDGFLSGIAKGSVLPSGRINVKIAKIHADGKLSGTLGSGAWRSKNCAGTWEARRA